MSTEVIISRLSRGKDVDAVLAMLSRRPITTNSISSPEFDPATIEHDAQDTRIIVHSRYPALVQAFLAHKRQHGSSIERALYSPDWTWEDQVGRLSKLLSALA